MAVDPLLDPRVESAERLTPAQVQAITLLAHAAAEADGVRPLSEHVMLHSRYGGDESGRHLLLYVAEGLAAYAHLDVSDAVAGASAEVVVHPDHRRRGYARLLVAELLRQSPGERLRLWAHGEHPAAAALAKSLGFSRSRVLWQMRRSLYATVPAPVFPADVTTRTFRPGQDEERWVALNATAFASHPEQGQWTVDDLRLRMREPWFDPQGFFLAERDGELVGFHWTKVHGAEDHGDSGHHHGHPAIGEVYVIAVAPTAAGRGLGKALTLLGLQHLRQRGLPDVMLYVEADNAAAIRLYTRLGFTRWETDVMFSRDPQ